MTLAAPRRWTVPLVRPDLPNFAELGPGIERIVASGMLTKGSVLDAFEADMRSVTGCRLDPTRVGSGQQLCTRWGAGG